MKLKTVDILVICNNEYNNYLLYETLKNLNEVVEYTNTSETVKIENINFILSETDKDKFYFVEGLLNFNYKILYVQEDKMPDIFNKVRDSTSDYVAFYSANCIWYKNHLTESINTLSVEKTKWNVSNLELRNSLSLKKDSVQSYRIPDKFNVLKNDIIIGELVCKAEDLKLVDFNRGVITEGSASFFSPAYALNAILGDYSVCSMSTVKFYMNFSEYTDVKYIDFDNYKGVTLKEEDKDKIIFSIIVNATNIKTQNEFRLILDSIQSQKFPADNYEIILMSNFNSFLLFFPEAELKKVLRNYKLIYIGNQIEGDNDDLSTSVYLSASKSAIGKYIVYLDIREGFIYTPAYLSEVYKYYASNDELFWGLSNYFDMINYMPRHSLLKVPNREHLFFTMFTHKKTEDIHYVNYVAIDKNFSNNKLSLVNIINVFQQQNLKGTILDQAILQKI